MPPNFQRPFALPPGAAEVILVRHGASERRDPDADEGMTDGHANPPLAPRGHEQAELVGARLGQLQLAAIFTSTLRRTQQTAAPLVAVTGLQPAALADLREIHLGDWETGGLHPERLATDPIAQRLFTEQRWEVIPGAETSADFGHRVWSAVEEVATSSRDGLPAVAFAHGGVIAEACRHVTGSAGFAFLAVENASITRLVRLTPDRWMLRLFNDTSHLDRLVGTDPP